MFRSTTSRSRGTSSREHKVTIHIASSASDRTFHRTMSWRAVRMWIGAGIALALVVVVGICGLFGWVGSMHRVRTLQSENDSLRVQFRRLGELETNLARMSELNEQMQRMLGVDPSALQSEADSLSGVE